MSQYRKLWRTSFILKMKLYQLGTLIFVLADLSSCARVGRWPLESCTKQGLKCDVQTSNCLTGWPVIQQFTPSSPEDLKVKVSIRQDEAGQSFPVINAQWKLRDEGSVSHLNGTELQVVVRANNQNICVKYSLYEHLKEERNPSGEQWSFTVDNVVVYPDQTYWVYVFNHPKPKINYTTYNVKEEITVPGCRDPEIKMTQFCIETGSLWQPNITVDWATENYSVLAVRFNTDVFSEKYRVRLRCPRSRPLEIYAYKNKQTSLNITYYQKNWPRICCDFTVEIKPHFPACENDCERREKDFNMCWPTPTPTPYTGLSQAVIFTYGAIVMVVLCVGVYLLYRLCRPNRDKGGEPLPSEASLEEDFLPKQPPKVLVIYSQDHRLYRDIVLKLCAFLQSKCGVEVLVDLLDSTSVGTVGRLRWLEWQRQQLTNPTDKVLVLCSRGVQAKWRAMCGQGPVTLREDVNSPTDDMLIPFLNLLLPDLHHPATLGKYIVAYFEGVSDERDVPSVFDIGVKYKLMKHFEELYFRILDREKFQPSQVNHIEGIGVDEFFSCPSGKALKDAIELFRAHQLENPDWFESECVDNEEELMAETNLLINQLEVPPVLEHVPLIRESSPVYMHNVEINHNNDSLFVRTPELNPEWNTSPVLELEPRIIPLTESVYPLNPLMVPTPGVHTASLYHTGHVIEPVYWVQPMSNKPPWPTEDCLNLEEQLTSPTPTENEEGEPSFFLSQSFPGYDQGVAAPHNSLNSSVRLPETRSVLNSRPIEIEDAVVAEHSGKGSSTGSDQGYMSRISSQHTSPLQEDDPLVALARLQEELFQKNHQHSLA